MPAERAAAPLLAAPVRTPIGKFGDRLGMATPCLLGGMGQAAPSARETA